MSKKVRRSYSRLETPGLCIHLHPRPPVLLWLLRGCWQLKIWLESRQWWIQCWLRVPRVSVKPWAPDHNSPGISLTRFVKEKRKKKKLPEILVSEGRGLPLLPRQTHEGDTSGHRQGGGSALALVVERQCLQSMGGDAQRRAFAHSPAPYFSSPRNRSWMEWAAAMNA